MIKTHINTLQRMIAYFLLISQLLTSCKLSEDPVENTNPTADNTAEEKEDVKLLALEAVRSNEVIAQEILGDTNYSALEAWKQLGIKDSEAEAIEIPILSDEMLVQIKKLQKSKEQPILFLDLGKSIEEIEKLCTVLKADGDDKQLRAETCYKATGIDCPRWLLLPGSDQGVLPGSRNKIYDDQVEYMGAKYPGYEVGGARELVTLAMLKYLQDGTVLFPKEPSDTWGRCKEQYQTGGWEGRRVLLGYRSSSASGGLVVFLDGHVGFV